MRLGDDRPSTSNCVMSETSPLLTLHLPGRDALVGQAAKIPMLQQRPENVLDSYSFHNTFICDVFDNIEKFITVDECRG